MAKETGTVTRKGSPAIKVYCLPEERQLIEENAKTAGLSVARYLREVGQGYQIKSIVDYAQVREMARINGDLGRLGGLLKLWLSDDKKMQLYSEKDIIKILEDIEAARLELVRTMSRIILPRK